MTRNNLVTFVLGVFAGLILVSTYPGQLSWKIDGSTITALCALGLSIWQGYINRRHNKLSVTPLLTSKLEQSKEHSCFQLKNKGLGIAKITGYNLLVNGRLVTNDKFMADFYQRMPQTEFTGFYLRHYDENSYIETKSSSTIVQLQAGLLTLVEREFIKNRYTVSVEYESLYGEQFKFKSAVYL